MFDIQTHTTLGLSTGITLLFQQELLDNQVVQVFLVSAATDADSITVYCNGGSFVKDESIKVNGNVLVTSLKQSETLVSTMYSQYNQILVSDKLSTLTSS